MFVRNFGAHKPGYVFGIIISTNSTYDVYKQ